MPKVIAKDEGDRLKEIIRIIFDGDKLSLPDILVLIDKVISQLKQKAGDAGACDRKHSTRQRGIRYQVSITVIYRGK